MKSVAYYSFNDDSPYPYNFCSIASDSAPLIVNCAGNFSSEFPFSTDNPAGRKDFYLMHITRGSLTVRLGNESVIADAGSVVLFPPECGYYYRFDGGGEINYLWSHFTGSYAAEFLDRLGFTNLPAIFKAPSKSHVSACFRSMFEIFSSDSTLKEHSLAASLMQILVALSERSVSGRADNPIYRSLSYINASYTEELRIPDLAAMENLSNSRYHVIFKKITGRSPNEYITDLRMRHACELLRSTDMPIKQVCLLTGYGDSHFFSRIFKANIGLSPSEFRHQTDK